MPHLTNEQINDIAKNCKCGYFNYDDDRGLVRLNFARAIEAACQANEAACQANDVDFPVLRIIENEHLRSGATIEMRDDYVCLIRADGEIVGRGDTLQGLLTELIFVLC